MEAARNPTVPKIERMTRPAAIERLRNELKKLPT